MLIIGVDFFLNDALSSFILFILTFPIYIAMFLSLGGGGYYLYWLFHRFMERSISLSHHDTLLRRSRHTIFVIFGVMNGLLIPLVISLVAIIDHKILSDWLKEDEGRLPIFLLTIIGFVGILVMILMRGKMMGVKLTLILITLTALSFMINNISNHILQALNIMQLSHHDAMTAKMLGDYGTALILWLGPGLILFWLHALFQRPPPHPLSPLIKHKRAVMIRHIGSACYLYLPIVMSVILLIVVTDIASGVPDRVVSFFFNALVFFAPVDSKDVIFFKWGIPFPLQAAFYSLGILLIYWRYVSLGFLMRLIVSLLPSLWVNFVAFAYPLACIDC